MGEGGIRARGIVKRFGRVVALDGVDLDVAPAEIVGLLGPNGAGKSTLLRILGTLVTPDAGEASIASVSIADDPAAARAKTGVLIGDERSMYWRLTGRQNLEFFGALHGMSKRGAATRAGDLLEAVGLTGAAERPVRNYSSGMRARLSLARALVGEPPVLLLDEPTRSLDPLATTRFRTAIAALREERGAAVLLATHDLHEAVELCDRAVVLSSGSVAYEGPTAKLDAAQLERDFLTAIESGHDEEPSGEAP